VSTDFEGKKRKKEKLFKILDKGSDRWVFSVVDSSYQGGERKHSVLLFSFIIS
jgi:hypothetical protein